MWGEGLVPLNRLGGRKMALGPTGHEKEPVSSRNVFYKEAVLEPTHFKPEDGEMHSSETSVSACRTALCHNNPEGRI
jgi:hypothetical protein